VLGDPAPERFHFLENGGAGSKAAFGEGYSYGLFLDQRDNRAIAGRPCRGWFPPLALAGRVSPAAFEVLNTFAYTLRFLPRRPGPGHRGALIFPENTSSGAGVNFIATQIDPAGRDSFTATPSTGCGASPNIKPLIW